MPDGVKRDAYIDPQVLADLTADTEARLAHPGKFLITILRRYWAEATADEATTSWRRTVRSNPGYAIDVLNCFHQIINDPPADLVELIVGQSRVIFYNVTSEGWKPFDVADYVAWLSTVRSSGRKSSRRPSVTLRKKSAARPSNANRQPVYRQRSGRSDCGGGP